jgi:hypothetical protein
MVQPEGPQKTIWRMCIASWILNTTNTHSQYVILVAFPLQQWLKESVSILHYTYLPAVIEPYGTIFKTVNLDYLHLHMDRVMLEPQN